MNATQIILIVFIAALIIVYPIMIVSRNKKESQRMQEQTNSLKRGDKVLTTSGVYGTIVDLHLENEKTIVTIETGTEKNRGYISVDSYAIYTIIKDEVKTEELIVENKVEEEKTEKEESLEEVKDIEASQEQPVETEKNTQKKGKKK